MTEFEPDLLTVGDLRRLTQLGRDSVYRLLESGEMRSIRVGKQYRVPRSEYEAWKARTLSQQRAPGLGDLPKRKS